MKLCLTQFNGQAIVVEWMNVEELARKADGITALTLKDGRVLGVRETPDQMRAMAALKPARPRAREPDGLRSVRDILSQANARKHGEAMSQAKVIELTTWAHANHVGMDELVKIVRREYMLVVLEAADFNVCRAARDTGKHRNSISRIAGELDIDVRKLRNGKKDVRPAHRALQAGTRTA